jgi:hypothetical protein
MHAPRAPGHSCHSCMLCTAPECPPRCSAAAARVRKCWRPCAGARRVVAGSARNTLVVEDKSIHSANEIVTLMHDTAMLAYGSNVQASKDYANKVYDMMGMPGSVCDSMHVRGMRDGHAGQSLRQRPCARRR